MPSWKDGEESDDSMGDGLMDMEYFVSSSLLLSLCFLIWGLGLGLGLIIILLLPLFSCSSSRQAAETIVVPACGLVDLGLGLVD